MGTLNKLRCSCCESYRGKEFFSVNNADKRGYQHWCKDCTNGDYVAIKAEVKAKKEAKTLRIRKRVSKQIAEYFNKIKDKA